MMSTRLFIGSFILALFTGCASQGVWYQESKSLAECQQDYKDCEYDTVKHGYASLKDDPSGIETVFRRLEILKACMQSKGYRLISRSEAEEMGVQVQNLK